jgi:hypothetical protein
MPLSEGQCAAFALEGEVQGAPEAINDAFVGVAGVLGHHQCVNAPLLHKLRRRVGVEADEERVQVGKRLQKVALLRALPHAANKPCQSDVDSRRLRCQGRECTLKGNSFSCQAEPCTNTATTRAQSCGCARVSQSLHTRTLLASQQAPAPVTSSAAACLSPGTPPACCALTSS